MRDEWIVNNFKSEFQFQSAAMMLISREFPKLRDLVWHVKNENYIPRKEGESDDQYELRCLREGGVDKSQGKLAGVPDIHVRYKGILYCIELKQPKGVLNPAQDKFHQNWNRDFGYGTICICYTLLDVYNYCKWIISNGYYIKTN